MNDTLREARNSALTLLAFAVIATALMAGVYALTYKTVRANEERAKLAVVAQTLVPGSYDNNPAQDALLLSAEQAARLDNDGPSQVFVAKQAGKAVGWVFESTAPNGYGGKIRLLVGIDRDGRVTGVRVVSHKETPGLGDYIDIGKSDWIKGFDGQSLERPDAWRVRKDGGQFDYMAGATITPRAVVAAVARTLAFFYDYRAELAGSTR
ncbi:hypothetical protein A9J41_09205 [Laribacter hongkongensis]|uniref:electron transport complex subunit RsxG n=1 Tax=Laribacter hongkongensis TaxID=168471 RepID=UPI001877BE59|nr:electron transport complex subunit RsxG [Laribacter hongkongensis]MBE5527686.1 hypothetical protein [Laribacter hongkongensis]